MINEDNNTFDGFDDSEMTDIDFFAVNDGDETPEEDKTQNPPKPEDFSKEGEEEQEQEESLFDAAENEEEEEDEFEDSRKPKENGADESSSGSGTETEEGPSIEALNLLKEKGLIQYELEENEILTEERAAEILEDTIEGEIFEQRLETLFDGLPDVVKEINKFALNGGDINEFLNAVSLNNERGLSTNLDLEDEANQELAIRHGLKGEGYDDEYINAQIEFLKDSGRMKKHSETHFNKFVKKRQEEEKAILKSQEQKKLQDKEDRRALKGKVSTFLKETEEINGFSISPSDKRQLPDYMSDRIVKMQNGNQITKMQKDLMRVLNSPTGSVQMAKLLKSATEDGELNFEEIKLDTETKVVKKVRDNVRRSKKSVISQSGGVSKRQNRPLADYFN
jgi:hypothetical protein